MHAAILAIVKALHGLKKIFHDYCQVLNELVIDNYYGNCQVDTAPHISIYRKSIDMDIVGSH